MPDQDSDRNQAATPHKLQKAREKGQVAKSSEVAGALVFTVAVAYLNWNGWDGLIALFRYDRELLAYAGRMDASAASMWHLIGGTLRDACLMLVPLLGAIVLAAVIGNIAQTGPVLSFEPVKVDFDRVNVTTGFRRVFSVRMLFEGMRAVTKLVLLAVIVYQVFRALVPQFFHWAAMPAGGLAKTLVGAVGGMGLRISTLLCIIAIVDWVYTRREFAKKMRMSRRELKEEHKHREGDPRIRARLRELRRQAVRRSTAARHTAHADVLLTNPTHYAVALKYVHGEMTSPKVVAKGAGGLAAQMRKIAARHGVPVVSNPPLVRELYRCADIDQYVPAQMYAQVARILVWVFAMRDARLSSQGSAT